MHDLACSESSVDCTFFTSRVGLVTDEQSCVNRCGEDYDPNNACHCNNLCSDHDNCCDDYEAECESKCTTFSAVCFHIPCARGVATCGPPSLVRTHLPCTFPRQSPTLDLFFGPVLLRMLFDDVGLQHVVVFCRLRWYCFGPVCIDLSLGWTASSPPPQPLLPKFIWTSSVWPRHSHPVLPPDYPPPPNFFGLYQFGLDMAICMAYISGWASRIWVSAPPPRPPPPKFLDLVIFGWDSGICLGGKINAHRRELRLKLMTHSKVWFHWWISGRARKTAGRSSNFPEWKVLSFEKNSSMELAVIWGNSDFSCSDFSCFDFSHSDFSHFFHQKFLLFSLNIHNFGTHLVHTQMEQMWPNRTFTHCFTTAPKPKYLPNIYLKFFFFYKKMTFPPELHLAPPKNHVIIFKNQMLPLKPLYNRLHFINILLSPNFYTFSGTEPFLHLYPIFSTLLNLNFLTSRTPKLKVPKILPDALSQTQIEPKEPKRSKNDPHLDCCTHTFGKGCLQVIWFHLLQFCWFFPKAPKSCNLFKTPKKHLCQQNHLYLSNCGCHWIPPMVVTLFFHPGATALGAFQVICGGCTALGSSILEWPKQVNLN